MFQLNQIKKEKLLDHFQIIWGIFAATIQETEIRFNRA